MTRENFKRFIVVAFIIVIITGVLYFGYGYFSNKKEPDNKKPEPTPIVIVNPMNQIELDETGYLAANEEYSYLLSVVNGNLVINSEIVPNVKAKYAYITNDFIMFTNKDNCGELITHVLGTDGNSKIYSNTDLLTEIMSDGIKFVAKTISNDDKCIIMDNVEIVYDGTNLTIK